MYETGSHERIAVECDLQVSETCKKNWILERRHHERWKADNEGLTLCIYCSRTTKFTGRTNPNTKYYFDDHLLDTIDSEQKAYFLGWIASGGCASEKGDTVRIDLHKKDITTLVWLRDFVCKDLPITQTKKLENPNMYGFSISSTIMSSAVCKWLKIAPGKKSDVVQFPDLATDELRWAFIRGYFCGDGTIQSPWTDTSVWPYPECGIASNSESMRKSIAEFTKIPCHNSDARNVIEWYGANAIDFLAKIFDGATCKLERKWNTYLEWTMWVPGLQGPTRQVDNAHFKWQRSRKDAVPPSKAHASDSGYDLTILEKVKQHGEVEFYDTGVKVMPLHGWYFDVVPRSSISKTGYMLANSLGVIDRSYTGSILVPLIKIDKNAPDLMLPNRIVQMIPRPVIHAEIVEVDHLDTTSREDGGFGSTGTK